MGRLLLLIFLIGFADVFAFFEVPIAAILMSAMSGLNYNPAIENPTNVDAPTTSCRPTCLNAQLFSP